MKKILESLKDQLDFESDEIPYLNKEKYDFGLIDKNNFFDSKKGEDKTVFFIDGGHQDILNSNTFSVAYNKICAVRFNSNKKEKIIIKKFWTSSVLKKNKEGLKYIVNSFSDDDFSISFEIDAYDSSISENRNRISPLKISSLARKLSEIVFAKQLCEKNKDSVFVLDGILIGNSIIEVEEFNKLYKTAIENNNIICSLAKTSNLVTDNGKSLSLAISNIASDKTWNYTVAESITDGHNAVINLVKLHERSDYIFRFEIIKEFREEKDQMIGLLKNNSCDPVFLGYPYGLVVADEMARVSNNESEYLKTILLSKAGKDAKEIFSLLRSSNAHSILDNIKF